MDLRLSQALGPVKLALADTAIKAERRRLRVFKDSVPCKPGCAGCCSRLVKVTMAEALIAYEHLVASGRWPEVRARAESQMPEVMEVSPPAWYMMNRKCPVLDPGTSRCLAHPVRPVLCSTHFVRSNPALCDPHAVVAGSYSPVQFNDLVEAFLKRMLANVAGSGILQLELPLPAALLLSERVNLQAGLTLDRVVSLFLHEF